MNPELTDKEKELSLLDRTLNDLKNCSNSDNELFKDKAIENAIFNIQRTIDLINGLYK